tara:strand:+ start:613 stop:744 length:132 start_codon:yes stop_codon:yes gene_type:complete
LSELYVAGHWRNIVSEEDPSSFNQPNEGGTNGTKDVMGQRAEK